MPEFSTPSSRLLETLTTLASHPNTFVYVLSGRGRQHLDEWFKNARVGLSAEHGCFYKHPDCVTHVAEDSLKNEIIDDAENNIIGNGWYKTVDQVETSPWKDTIRPLFKHYTVHIAAFTF